MEKVKAFVIKHQLWFKLAAIALLVCTIFTPTILQIPEKTPFISIWSFIYHHIKYGEIPLNREYIFFFVSSYIFVISAITVAVLLLISIFRTKSLIFCLYIYLIDFVFFIIGASFLFYSYPSSIPHVGFYIELLLFIIDIICIIFQIKYRLRTSNKNK